MRERLTWLQMILGVVVFIVAEIVIGIPLGVAMVVDPHSPSALGWGLLAGMTVGAAVAAAGFWLVVRFVGGRPATELARTGALREFGAGLAIGAVLISAVMGVLALLGVYRVHGIGWTPGIISGLAIGIGPAFIEEIFFRGLLLRLLDRWLGSWIALTVSALLFGLIHLSNPYATVFGSVAIALEAGILMGAAFLLTRRLWLSIGIHLAWNFMLGGFYGADVSGTGFGDGLLKATFTGPDLLTGGGMGPEGSIVALVVCTTAGVALLVAAVRRGRMLPRVRNACAGPAEGELRASGAGRRGAGWGLAAGRRPEAAVPVPSDRAAADRSPSHRPPSD